MQLSFIAMAVFVQTHRWWGHAAGEVIFGVWACFLLIDSMIILMLWHNTHWLCYVLAFLQNSVYSLRLWIQHRLFWGSLLRSPLGSVLQGIFKTVLYSLICKYSIQGMYLIIIWGQGFGPFYFCVYYTLSGWYHSVRPLSPLWLSLVLALVTPTSTWENFAQLFHHMVVREFFV